jgi:uncharacterized protein YkwD
VTPRRLLPVGLALALSCTRGGGDGTRSPGVRMSALEAMDGIELVELRVEPRGAPQRSYGEAVDHALSPIERAIVDEVGELGFTHLPAASRLAREVAVSAPDRTTVPPALVDGLMAWAGLVDPPPRLIVVELPDDRAGCDQRYTAACDSAIGSLLEQLRSVRADDARLLFGAGVVRVRGGTTRMIVSVVERTIDLQPVPRRVRSGDGVDVRGRLLGERVRPIVEVIGPRGQWQQVSPRGDGGGGGFAARVECSVGDGVYQVEVLAEGTHGPEVVANFPISCGVDVAREIRSTSEKLEPDITAEQIAAANFHLVNAVRAQRGLPALRWDDRAAAVAEAHCEDMIKNGFVGHRSPRTGDVRDRFSRAKIRGSVIRETVARGYGPAGIHDSLMRSPGHQVNILAADVTHLGVGAVVGEPETEVEGAPRPIWLTQNFFRAGGAGAPASAAELAPALRKLVDAARKTRGQQPLRWHDGLSRVADKLARAYARSRALPKGYEKDVFALGFGSVESHVASSIDFEQLAGMQTFAEPLPNVGIGVVRVREAEGETFLVVVLVASK